MKRLAVIGLSFLLLAPMVRAQDRDDEDKKESVVDKLKETLEEIPRKIQEALGDAKKQLDPEKARALEKRLRKALEEIKDAIDPSTEKVRVQVGDREMDVPAKKGSARLY